MIKVILSEVLTPFYLHNNLSRDSHISNTNNHAKNNLLLADELLKEWYKVNLRREDLLKVILPWHLSEGGEIELVPKSGLTVEKAVEKLKKLKKDYKEKSKVCWGKIEFAKKSQFTPIFLSTKAIDTEDYKGLETKEGLIHLDGLHRMVSWELNNLLDSNKTVEAYIAGTKKQILSWINK